MSDSVVSKWRRLREALPLFIAAAAAGYATARVLVPLLRRRLNQHTTPDAVSHTDPQASSAPSVTKAESKDSVPEQPASTSKAASSTGTQATAPNGGSTSASQVNAQTTTVAAASQLPAVVRSGSRGGSPIGHRQSPPRHESHEDLPNDLNEVSSSSCSDTESVCSSRGSSGYGGVSNVSAASCSEVDSDHPRILHPSARQSLNQQQQQLLPNKSLARPLGKGRRRRRLETLAADAEAAIESTGTGASGQQESAQVGRKTTRPHSKTLASVPGPESDARMRRFSACAQDMIPEPRRIDEGARPKISGTQSNAKQQFQSSKSDDGFGQQLSEQEARLHEFVKSSAAMFSSSSESIDGGELLLAMPPPPVPRLPLEHSLSTTSETLALKTTPSDNATGAPSVAGAPVTHPMSPVARAAVHQSQSSSGLDDDVKLDATTQMELEISKWEQDEASTPLPLPRYKRACFREPSALRGRPQLIIIAQELPIIVSRINAAEQPTLPQSKAEEGSDTESEPEAVAAGDTNWWRIDLETGSPPPLICPKSGWKVQFKDFRDILVNLAATVAHSHYVCFVGLLPEGVPHDPALISLLKKRRLYPVLVDPSLRSCYVHEFCRSYLWPVYHYIVPSGSFGSRWRRAWIAYDLVNRAIARTVLDVCVHKRASIWMNDSPVILVPLYLRPLLARAQLCFMINTPFPSSDIYRVLPSRDVLLKSLLASDLLGFHVFDYSRHFLSACQRVLNVDYSAMDGGLIGVTYLGHTTCVINAHTGVPFDTLRAYAATPKVVSLAKQIRHKHLVSPNAGSTTLAESFIIPELDADLQSDQPSGVSTPVRQTKRIPRVLMLAIDSLALNKAVVQKLQAYGRYLEQNPQDRDQAVLVVYLAPVDGPRDYVETLTKPLVKAEVERIHAAYGKEVLEVIGLDSDSKDPMPLVEYIAALSACSVLLTTSFWEGLNLTPIEATAATSPASPFVLILSEFVGCARAFSGALRVNPWAIQKLTDAIRFAVVMSVEARRRSYQKRLEFASRRSFRFWCERVLSRLVVVAREGESVQYVALGPGPSAKVIGVRAGFAHVDLRLLAPVYRHARQRILLFDYDGTLTSPVRTFDENTPPSKAVIHALRQLSEDPANVVFIMSGRGRPTLHEFFHNLPELGIAAEKGYFIRWPRRLLPFREAEVQLLGNANPTTSAKSKGAIDGADSSYETDGIPEVKVIGAGADGDSNESHLSNNSIPLRPPESSGLQLDEQGWELMLGDVDSSWRKVVLRLVYDYWRSTDGSWIELKDSAISWHFEGTELQFGNRQASELKKYLEQALQGSKIDVVRLDSRILEIRPRGISKGNATKHILRVAERYFAHQLAEFHRKVPLSPQIADQLAKAIVNEQTSLVIESVESRIAELEEQAKHDTHPNNRPEEKSDVALLGPIQRSTVATAVDVVTASVLEQSGPLPPLQLNQGTQEVSNPLSGLTAHGSHGAAHAAAASAPSGGSQAVSGSTPSTGSTTNATQADSEAQLVANVKAAALSARRFGWVKTLSLTTLRYLYRALNAGRTRPMIFAIGDDKSDESTFAVLAEHAASMMPTSTLLSFRASAGPNLKHPLSPSVGGSPLPTYLKPTTAPSDNLKLTPTPSDGQAAPITALTLKSEFSSHPALAHSSVPIAGSFTLFDVPTNALDLDSGAEPAQLMPTAESADGSSSSSSSGAGAGQKLHLPSLSPSVTLSTLASASAAPSETAAVEAAAPAYANIFTVKVRCQPSEAQFYVNNENEAIALLCGLAAISRADLHYWRKVGLSLRQAQLRTRHMFRALRHQPELTLVAAGKAAQFATKVSDPESQEANATLTETMVQLLKKAPSLWEPTSSSSTHYFPLSNMRLSNRWTLESFGMGAIQAARLHILEVTRKDLLDAITRAAKAKRRVLLRRKQRRSGGVADARDDKSSKQVEEELDDNSWAELNVFVQDQEEELEEEEEDDGDGNCYDEELDTIYEAPHEDACAEPDQDLERTPTHTDDVSTYALATGSDVSHQKQSSHPTEFEHDNLYLM